VAQRRFGIAETDTALTLHQRATYEARMMFRDIYPQLRAGIAPRIPQDSTLASYFGRRTPADGHIDWQWPCRRVYDLIRAVTHPYPGAFTSHADRSLVVWWGRPDDTQFDIEPGRVEVSSDAIRVGTGHGALRLERVQADGQPETDPRDWVISARVRSGDRLGPAS
jgi:methionyl-tRNA formyltransferase